MHSDAGQHHNHVVVVVVVVVVAVVVVILFSVAGDALWCGSECFGCERLFPNLLLRCSWIRRRHQVVPINQYGILNKAKLNFQNVDIAWSVYKYQRQKRKNCRYTERIKEIANHIVFLITCLWFHLSSLFTLLAHCGAEKGQLETVQVVNFNQISCVRPYHTLSFIIGRL